VVVVVVVVVEEDSRVVVFVIDDVISLAVFAVSEYVNAAPGEITLCIAPLGSVIIACGCDFDEAVFPEFMFVVAAPVPETALPTLPISLTFPITVL
jgi:hypothetical protein